MDDITIEDFKLIFNALLKNKLLIALITMAGVFSGLIYTANQPNEYIYESTSTVCVTYSTYQQTSAGSVMINYSDIVVSNRVCEYAASLLNDQNLTPTQIQQMIGVSISSNSYVMKIRARSPSPQMAIRVVNAIAESFVTQVSAISGNQSIQVLDAADSAYIVSNSDRNQIRILAAAGAFLLGCGWVAVREFFNNKVRSVAQCVEDENEILGMIPYAE